eukprot:TRINITY_DN4247_c0_g1_i1.p1 TRINITY_DN4247_c0_g1~~TRINITY_DN4247_c0_g1_i1.p1  ORF type:complete len:720 (-),score=136.68 TRINITY_DN4247_c0_g1_i1:60-2099(-)
MTYLDDVCNFPKGTDEKFLGKISEAFANHAHFGRSTDPNEFIIKHYAGDVSYNIHGFCDKNKDTLFKDLVGLADVTSSAFVKGLFPEVREIMQSKAKPTTAGFKIKNSINELVVALSSCTPHYIRCIKPNETKSANSWDSKLSTRQVKYLGLLENVRIRRAGYAYRQLYDKFFYRYRVVCPKTWPNWTGDFKTGAEAILQHVGLKLGDYQLGNTKIFVRAPETVFNLEELRERTVFTYASKIQRFFLRTSLKRYYYNVKKSGNDKLLNSKERRRLSLDRPFHSDYIGYRMNFGLKDVVKDGSEKTIFTDVVSKYDRRSRLQRRILLVSKQNLRLVAIDKNKTKDKEERKRIPYVYCVKRVVPLSKIEGFVLSSLADNFVLMNVVGEHGSLFECRRKTELLGTLMQVKSDLRVSFSDSLSVVIKKKKKPRAITFVKDESGGPGRIKKVKVSVATGLPKSSTPTLEIPPDASSASYNAPAHEYKVGGLRRKNADPPRGGQSRGRARGGMGRGRGVSPPARGRGAAPPARGGRGAALPSPGRGGNSGGGGEYVKALYDFVPENADELEFKAGAVVQVISKESADWWTGKYQNRTGIFPANFVAPTSAPSGGGNRGRSPGRGGRGRGHSPARGRGRGGRSRSPGGRGRGRGGRGRGRGALPTPGGRGRGGRSRPRARGRSRGY